MVNKANMVVRLRDRTAAGRLAPPEVYQICDVFEDETGYHFDQNSEPVITPASENAALEGAEDPEPEQTHYDAEEEDEESVVAPRGRRPKVKPKTKPVHKHRR
jgi:hypothetical protein